MPTNPLSMALTNSDPKLRSRLLMAQQMAEEGSSTAPVQSPLEGLARALKAGLGGYFAGQVEGDEKAKKAETQAVLARALSAGAGTENTFDSKTGQWSGPSGKAAPALMAKILAGNEQTAPMGLNLQLQEMQYGRERQDKLADQKAQFERQLTGAGLRMKADGSGFEAIPGFGQAQGVNAAAAARPMIDVKVAEQGALMPGVVRQAGQVAGATANAQLPAQQQMADYNAGIAQTAADAATQRQINYGGDIAQSQAAGTLAAQNAPVNVSGPNGPMQVPAGAAVDLAKADVKPPTEGERNASGFAARAIDAERTVREFEDVNSGFGAATGIGVNMVRNFPLLGSESAANLISGSDRQRFQQAQRQFTEARLRKESGAAIPTAEYTNDAVTYFPQPGDSTETIARKREARKQVIESLRVSAGRSAPKFDLDASAPTTAPGAANAPPPPPGFVVQ